MPQMSPYNWLTLNLFFSSLMIIMMKLIHFTSITPPILMFNYKKNKKFPMKW